MVPICQRLGRLRIGLWRTRLVSSHQYLNLLTAQGAGGWNIAENKKTISDLIVKLSSVYYTK